MLINVFGDDSGTLFFSQTAALASGMHDVKHLGCAWKTTFSLGVVEREAQGVLTPLE